MRVNHIDLGDLAWAVVERCATDCGKSVEQLCIDWLTERAAHEAAEHLKRRYPNNNLNAH